MTIKPMEIISSMSGKVCMHSDMYFRTNRMSNKVTTGKVCFPSTATPTASQTKAKQRFKKVAAAVRTRLTALDTAAKAAMRQAAKAAMAGSVFGYAYRLWNSEYDTDGNLITA